MRNPPRVGATNAEIVRSSCAAFAAGEWRRACRPFDRSIQWIPPAQFPTTGVYHGVRGVFDWFDQLNDAYQAIDTRLVDLIEAGDGRIIAVTQIRAQGRRSGLELDEEWAQVWTLYNGRVTGIEMYTSRRDALDACAGPNDLPRRPGQHAAHGGRRRRSALAVELTA